MNHVSHLQAPPGSFHKTEAPPANLSEIGPSARGPCGPGGHAPRPAVRTGSAAGLSDAWGCPVNSVTSHIAGALAGLTVSSRFALSPEATPPTGGSPSPWD